MDPVGGGAAATLRASVAVCVKEPDTPLRVTVAFPIVAFDAAVSVMLCGVPGVRVRVVGLAVTPVGSPLIVTLIVPLKLLRAVAFIEMGWPGLPAVSDRLPGDAESVKSGAAVTVSAVVAR